MGRQTLISMFYNNMAAESLVNGDLDRAYALIKADYRHEFFFGLSKTDWALGDEKRAKPNMDKALALSRDESEPQRYQSKLQVMLQH
ncbi:MAG: hypothetical protein ACRC1W_17520 [Shewanella sp.]